MNKRVVEATNRFEKNGYSCSQSVFSAFAKGYGLDEDAALKIASSFGGGIGHMGDICGAVTGAFMVIGLKYGKNRKINDEEYKVIDNLVGKFVNEFKSRNGSILCKDLLGYNMNKAEERKQITEQQLTAKLCPKFVKDSAEILEEIL